MDILTRFLKYVSIPTPSSSSSNLTPSTNSQKDLAEVLAMELENLGLEVYYDKEHCYLYGTLKGNVQAPKIGFISHLDTFESVSGENITPKIIPNYQGNDIYLKGTVLSSNEYPDLKNHYGKTLITSDGTTLLGADDKAGIAEIMTMLEYFVNNNINHGDIVVAFTPDEEIGRGIEHFDFERFPVDFAYTVDGSSLGRITYENFNAATATIEIKGTHVHLGTAKDKLVNALIIAHEIEALLPSGRPETTSGKKGFYHLKKEEGTSELAKITYLIRDFDSVDFIKRKLELEIVIGKLQAKYGDRFTLNIRDTYHNMRETIEDYMFLISIPRRVMDGLNITPVSVPIRGGTDGASLTEMGIPCPDIGTGGHNFHSVHEYICLEDMEKVVDILIGVVKEFSQDKSYFYLRRY